MERSGSGGLPRSNSLVVPQGFSPYADPGNDHDGPGTLGVTFRNTLDPQARAEKVKHLSKRHPAIIQSQQMNETLVCIQQSLRKMPGIASRESTEIIEQLKRVGVIVSQEWSQLVDALMHMKLDAEDVNSSISRLTIEASLNKADLDDKEQRIKNLLRELETTTAERDELMKRVAEEEHEKREVMEGLRDIERLWGDRRSKKKQSGEDSDSSAGSQEMIKRLEETIRCLDEQVNERRGLWITQNGVVPAVPRASSNIAFPAKASEPARSKIQRPRLPSLETTPLPAQPSVTDVNSPSGSQFGMSQRAVNPFERSQSVAPSSFPVAAHGYQNQATAAAQLIRPPSRFGQWGTPNSQVPHPRSQSHAPSYQSPMGRGPPPRQGGYPGAKQRYRGNAPEFTPSAAFSPPDSVDVWRQSAPNIKPREPYNRGPQLQSPARHKKIDSGLRPPSEHHHQPTNVYSAAMARAAHQSSIIHMTDRCVMAWREQMGQFYDAIRFFVNSNAAEIDVDFSERLEKSPFWGFVLQCYNPLNEQDAATYVEGHLKDPVAKPCLVTRALVDFVVNYVWTPSAWNNFDHDSTVALAEVKGGLDGSKGQPSFTKQPYLDRLAAVIDTIQKQPAAEGFHKGKVAQLTAALLEHIMPLVNLSTPHATAYHQLEPVAEIAWTLSSKILTSRLTFDFRFPEVGSRFSNQCMIPIWPELDPLELQAKHWRIALVTTPVVTCRNDTGSNISAHSIVHADVFCMQ